MHCHRLPRNKIPKCHCRLLRGREVVGADHPRQAALQPKGRALSRNAASAEGHVDEIKHLGLGKAFLESLCAEGWRDRSAVCRGLAGPIRPCRGLAWRDRSAVQGLAGPIRCVQGAGRIGLLKGGERSACWEGDRLPEGTIRLEAAKQLQSLAPALETERPV
uniref:Uncharacterized protein n=1 Tax=Macaca fascicularis TaxID=9541 RepID=A0A2K5UX46_MACFA